MKVRVSIGVHPLFAIGANMGQGPEIMKDLVESALLRVGAGWKKDVLPQHFEVSAPSAYPGEYTDRTPKYNAKKTEPRPMVLTGDMMERFLNGAATITASATPKMVKATIVLPSVRKANFWAGNSIHGPHDFGRELTAVNEEDLNRLHENLENIVMDMLAEKIKEGEHHMPTETTTAA